MKLQDADDDDQVNIRKSTGIPRSTVLRCTCIYLIYLHRVWMSESLLLTKCIRLD